MTASSATMARGALVDLLAGRMDHEAAFSSLWLLFPGSTLLLRPAHGYPTELLREVAHLPGGAGQLRQYLDSTGRGTPQGMVLCTVNRVPDHPVSGRLLAHAAALGEEPTYSYARYHPAEQREVELMIRDEDAHVAVAKEEAIGRSRTVPTLLRAAIALSEQYA